MKNLIFLKIVPLFLFAVFLVSCASPPPPIKNTETAYQKLKELCIQDLEVNPVIRTAGKTLYVYIPVSRDLFTMKIADSNKSKTAKRQINFVETTENAQGLNISFNVGQMNIPQKSPSYTNAYTDEFSKIHNGLLMSINRALGDLGTDPPPPDFIVLLIVNTESGVGIKNIFHYLDLKKYLAQALPYDEYIKRYITEPIGDEKFLNNQNGKGLDFQDITWLEFIAKQITNRITLKYGRSDFPPTDSNTNEIMAIVNDTVNAYNFEDFKTIELKDLASGETYTFNKGQLETFAK